MTMVKWIVMLTMEEIEDGQHDQSLDHDKTWSQFNTTNFISLGSILFLD